MDNVYHLTQVTKHTKGGVSNYHTDRDCQYIRDKPNERLYEVTEAVAQERGLVLCKACNGEHPSNGTTDMECPLCGSDISKLATHLQNGCDAK